MHARSRQLAALVAAAIVMVGCSGDDDASSATTDPMTVTTEPAADVDVAILDDTTADTTTDTTDTPTDTPTEVTTDTTEVTTDTPTEVTADTTEVTTDTTDDTTHDTTADDVDTDTPEASPGADTPVGRALTAELMSESASSPVSTEAEARCWSGQIVDGVGEDRLTELGVTAGRVGDFDQIAFEQGEIETVVDGLFECVDVRSALVEEFETDLGREAAECVADEMDQELVSAMLTASFAGAEAPPPEFQQRFLDIAATCDLPIG